MTGESGFLQETNILMNGFLLFLVYLRVTKVVTARQTNLIRSRKKKEKKGEGDEEIRKQKRIPHEPATKAGSVELCLMGTMGFTLSFMLFGSPCKDKYVIGSIASGLLWWVWLY